MPERHQADEPYQADKPYLVILDIEFASNYLNFDVVLQHATKFTIINISTLSVVYIVLQQVSQMATSDSLNICEVPAGQPPEPHPSARLPNILPSGRGIDSNTFDVGDEITKHLHRHKR